GRVPAQRLQRGPSQALRKPNSPADGPDLPDDPPLVRDPQGKARGQYDSPGPRDPLAPRAAHRAAERWLREDGSRVVPSVREGGVLTRRRAVRRRSRITPGIRSAGLVVRPVVGATVCGVDRAHHLQVARPSEARNEAQPELPLRNAGKALMAVHHLPEARMPDRGPHGTLAAAHVGRWLGGLGDRRPELLLVLHAVVFPPPTFGHTFEGTSVLRLDVKAHDVHLDVDPHGRSHLLSHLAGIRLTGLRAIGDEHNGRLAREAVQGLRGPTQRRTNGCHPARLYLC